MSNLRPEPARQRGGWISPEGDYYFCEYGQHVEMEYALAKQFYQTDRVDTLRNRGWIHLHDDGTCGYDYESYELSQAQLDTLWTLYEAAPTPFTPLDYKENMGINLGIWPEVHDGRQ